MSSQQRYISNELTHLAGRGQNSDEQYQTLIKILKEKRLLWNPKDKNTWGEGTAEFIYKYNNKISDNEMINPSMICFCDIPFEDLTIHIKKYTPFGLSFTKELIASKGGSPVLYVPRRAAVRFMEPKYKNDCFDKYCKEFYHYFDSLFCNMHDRSEIERIQKFYYFILNQVFSYVKFFNHTLSEDHVDNYYFEREWRILGNFYFRIEDVQRVIFPQSFAKQFRRDCPEYYGQISFI